MGNQSRLQGAIRLALGGALGLASGFTGLTALAQESTSGDKGLETVYVTGSRIARTSDFENPAPVVTFDKGDLDKSGYNNLQQLLEEQPFVGNGTFSTRGNNQDSTANGAASVSLRGLGADATLVLVNGRRVAVSAFAEGITTSFVDINTIPVAAIERLEVLKDGASAVYGADAVAGVVNVILRKDFDGFEVSGGAGAADGYDEYNASAIWGLNGDDSNITMILDYFKNSTLENVERGSLGTADQTAYGGVDNRSSRGFPGSFTVDGVNTVDPACPEDRIGGPSCFYDYGPWNLLQPESERTGLMVLGRKGFGNDVEFFTEFAAQHNRSIAQGAPTPYDAGAFLTVPTSHPGNPFVGAEEIKIRRYRSVDAGPRQWDIETDNLRLVLGLRGKLMDRWNWEVAAQRARSESEQAGDKSMGWVRTDLLQSEINAGRYNPFGGTYNPQAVIDAITTNVIRQGTSEMTSADAQISGELFDLPGGKVAMAAGLEYREESIKDTPDQQFQEGLIFGTEAVSAEASRDNWSAFLEFSLPVLETLEVDLAVRYDDYSDFGNTTNPKVSARWEPIEGLAFRTSWGTGFRAPSLAQIGLGPSAESQFFKDTYWCAEQGISLANCQVLDYTINFTGNPNLEAEDSENFNIGVAWKPNDMWTMSLDYWDIKQEKKIDEEPFGYLYQNFCATQTSTACVRNTPAPGDTLGELQSINATFTNIGEQTTNGVDLSVYFRSDLAGGDLTLGLDYSRMLEFQKVELSQDGTTLVERDLTGEYEYPEDRFVLTGDFGFGDWGVRGAINYIGSFEDQPDVDFDGVLDYDSNTTRKVDAFTTLNLQARYTGFEGLTLALGLDNALDEDPPFAIGDGDTDLYGYVSGLHDPRGRFFYGKVSYRF